MNNDTVYGETKLLRDLRYIQISVPDRSFFANLQIEMKTKDKRRKKKGRLFSGASIFSGKKLLTVKTAREQITAFSSSFQNGSLTKSKRKSHDTSIMSIQEMADFRVKIKIMAEAEEKSYAFRAVEAIVKFIDLQNSGVVAHRQAVLLDCLKHLGLALLEDGGLSMFHTTWFLSVYRQYLRHYRMFRNGEYNRAVKCSNKEAQTIAANLFRKQYEIPLYRELINEGNPLIKQMTRYSQDSYVVRSVHGQKGCTLQYIQKIFQAKAKAERGRIVDQNYLNEINLIMSYALLFSQIPMMYQLVEKIIKAIPNMNTETTLYKEKIVIAQKLMQLDIMNGISKNDGSELYYKKLNEYAYGVYKHCTNLISDNRMSEETLTSDIHTFPFIKQATILITYRRIFFHGKKSYLQMLENTIAHLQVLNNAAQGKQKHLMKFLDYINMYERALNAIISYVNAQLVENG